MRIVDQSGAIINHLSKTKTGTLVVSNTDEYNRYLQSKKQAEQMKSLESRVNELSQNVNSILALLTQLTNKSDDK